MDQEALLGNILLPLLLLATVIALLFIRRAGRKQHKGQSGGLARHRNDAEQKARTPGAGSGHQRF